MFADAPHVLKPADFVWNQGRSEEALKAEVAANEASMAAEADPSLTPRAWWNPNPERTIAYGLTDSVALIMDLLKREKFDVSAMPFSSFRLAKESCCGFWLVWLGLTNVLGCLWIQVRVI